MSVAEAAILLTGAALLFGAPWGAARRRPWLLALLAALVLALGAHFALGESRWQMVPAYAAASLAFVLGLLRLRRKEARRRSRLVLASGLLGAALLVLLAALPPLALPVPRWDLPSGRYAAGVRAFAFTDGARPERWTPDPADRREVVVRAWYPAAPARGPRAPYVSKGEARAFSNRLKDADGRGPGFLLTHLRNVRTHARQDAPPAPGRFPVLLFNHGYSGVVGQNTALMEHLASRGYVVLSIGHPYGAAVLEHPDGRLTPLGRTDLERDLAGPRAARLIGALQSENGPAEHERAVRDVLGATRVIEGVMAEWAADNRFVLDRVERGGFGPLDAAMDPSRIGLFGHSLGGAAAVAACDGEPRCDAVINIDGMQYGGYIRRQVGKPLLMIYTDHPNRGVLYNDLMYRSDPFGAERTEALVLRGAGHLDATDLALAVHPLLKRAIPPGLPVGPIAGGRAVAVLDDVTAAFFDQTLNGRAGALAAAVASHPELRRHRARFAAGGGPRDGPDKGAARPPA